MSLRQRPEPQPRRVVGLDLRARHTQIKVGAVAAFLLLVIAVGVAVALSASKAPATSTNTGATQPQATASASHSQATPAPSAAASPAAAPAAKVPPLTGVVTAGSGGTGYKVARIRSGSPGNGITRLVLDLEGAGPTPSVQLGRGPDGADYLVASGISIDPSLVQGFKGSGAVSDISQVSPDGLTLKLTMAGSPQFAIVYLNSPSRLVIDFK